MSENPRAEIEQVAGCLGRGAYGVDHRLDAARASDSRGYALVGVVISVTHAHDEVVFIAVAEQGIVGRDGVEKIVGALGEVHIVDVDEVKLVTPCVGAVDPLVFPRRTRDDAGVLGPLLIVARYGQLGGHVETLAHAQWCKGKFKARECDADLSGIFGVAVVDESVERARQAFVVHAQTGSEEL